MRKANYKLTKIKELAVLRSVKPPYNRELNDMEKLGYSLDDALKIIVKLRESNFFESRHEKEPPADVYKYVDNDITIYIKIGILKVQHKLLLEIISFHEDR